jgi:ribose transport system substrate-binding protein
MLKQLILTTALTAASVIGFLAASSAPAQNKAPRKIVIGMVAKSQSNDVFQAAYAGAKDAAKEFGQKYNAEITIDWRTPTDEDAAKQAENIEALTRAQVDGILVSCSNAETVTPAIDAAVDKDIPVMMFDSDAPKSKRFAFYGTDDYPAGKRFMSELAKVMGGKGTVAILAGNQSAPNLQKRVEGAKDALKDYPDIKLLASSGGVFYHQETPEKAAEEVERATNANPDITGWCMIGGWPLFTSNALKWEPGKIKVVSCDALPAQLSYLKTGHVQMLLAQDCYGWGHKSVEVLLEKIVNNKSPETPRIVDPLTVVTKENVDEYGKQWEKWLKK